jgi:hypothetical protein
MAVKRTAAWSEEKPHAEFSTGFMHTGGAGITNNNSTASAEFISDAGFKPYHPAVPKEGLKPGEHKVIQMQFTHSEGLAKMLLSDNC